MPTLLPGDVLPLPQPTSSSLKLGPGLLPTPCRPASHPSSPSLTAIRPGQATYLAKPRALYVSTYSRRYSPAHSDAVIGVITARTPDHYLVSLASSHTATLPLLSFHGATKRHRPNLPVGTLVYALVASALPFTDPELTCVLPTGDAAGYGPLLATDSRARPQGTAMVFAVSLPLAARLWRGEEQLLALVARCFPFEAAVGVNGFVWVRAAEVRMVVALGSVLREADARSVALESAQHKTLHPLNANRQCLDATDVRRIVEPFL
ncbi:exosome non-catalytic core subunit rrp40 [Thecaphora frezii]